MTRIGFLGLGAMGAPMARNLLAAGHELVVWNRSPEAVRALNATGAVAAATPAEALGTGISFSMLADDRAVGEVLGRRNLEAGTGGIHMSFASISPNAAEALAERAGQAGVDCVGGAVLGRPPVAEAGQLHILAAGRASTIDVLEPLLLCMGRRVWRIGSQPRQANVAKVAVNYNLLVTLQALGESIAMVERQGIDPAEFIQLLTGSLFAGGAHSGYGDIIAARNYSPPGFTMPLGLKDLGLAEDLAASAGVRLGIAAPIRRAFEAALADPDLAGLDWSAVAEIVRRS